MGQRKTGRSRNKFTQLSIWLPDNFLRQAKEMVSRLDVADFDSQTPYSSMLGKITKSDVLRLAILRGLVVLDSELPKVKKK